jgi:uncharacterized protein (TIGR00369 family)
MTNLEELGRDVLRAQPFARWTETELVSIAAGRVELALTIRPDLLQQHGFVHGGVVSYLADNALTFAGGSILGDAVTSEMKINYVRPAIGDRLLARAEAIATGSRQVVCRCDVFAIRGEESKLCATALGTITRASTG